MDRTFRGLVAGMIAGIAMNIWNLTDYYFVHFTNLRLTDWVAVLAGGEKSKYFSETVINLVVQIIWDGFLGVIFAHLLTKITSQGVIIKSVLYATLLWFIFRTFAVIFRLTPLVAGQTFPGRLSNLLGTVLWGLILGWALKRFDLSPEK
jgi:hypothetical protein